MHRAGIGRVRMRGAEQQRAKLGRVQPVRQFPPQHAAFRRRALAGDDGDAAHPVGVGVGQEPAQRAVRLVHAAPVQIQDALRPGSAAPQVAPAPRVQPARRGADPESRPVPRRWSGGATAAGCAAAGACGALAGEPGVGEGCAGAMARPGSGCTAVRAV